MGYRELLELRLSIFLRSVYSQKTEIRKSWCFTRPREFTQNLKFVSVTTVGRSAMAVSQRSRVITLYKNLLYLGRDYPQGYDFFRSKCHATFLRNKDLEEDQVEEWLAKGDYIIKELEALYMLKKYRTLKRRYYDEKAS